MSRLSLMKLVDRFFSILSFFGSKYGVTLVVGTMIAFLLVNTRESLGTSDITYGQNKSPINSRYKGLIFTTKEIEGIEFDLRNAHIEEEKKSPLLSQASQEDSTINSSNERKQEEDSEKTPTNDNTSEVLLVLSPTSVPEMTPTSSPEPTKVPDVIEEKITQTSSDEVWEKLASCESGLRWDLNTGNGYFGGLQFSQNAWESVGGSGNPSDASREEQIERGKELQERRGWGVWSTCAQKLGLN